MEELSQYKVWFPDRYSKGVRHLNDIDHLLFEHDLDP